MDFVFSFKLIATIFVFALSTVVYGNTEKQRIEYASCSDDAKKLENYIKHYFAPLNTENTLDFKGLENSKSILKKNIKRFSTKDCGNLNNNMGLSEGAENYDFFTIGMRLESLLHFVEIILQSYKDFENNELREVKDRLNNRIEYVLEELEKNP